MKSSLCSIIERVHDHATRKKAKPVQWHSRKEANAEWRLIMAKYRSPLSEAQRPNIDSPEEERTESAAAPVQSMTLRDPPHDPLAVGVGVPPALAGGLAQRLAAVRISRDLAAAGRRRGAG
jgi:hypothetical protein